MLLYGFGTIEFMVGRCSWNEGRKSWRGEGGNVWILGWLEMGAEYHGWKENRLCEACVD